MVAAIAAGCAGHVAYEHGVQAEKRGEAHLAYAFYAKAAQSSPDNGTYDRALRRLGPLAATRWMTEAKLARAEGRYGDAWKDCMRALAIQPDRSEALTFYDDLQNQYGARIAGVEREWRKKGAQALAIKVSPETPPRRAELPESQLSKADTEAIERSNAPRPPASVEPARQNVVQSGPPTGAYLAVHNLSRDGEREATSVDGVVIRLRDTDDEGTVDLDLYDTDRRIQTIRGLKAGESRLLLSPAGKWYRLTILDVDDASNSAKVGLNPA